MAAFLKDNPGSSSIAAQQVPPEQVSLYGIIDGAPEKGQLRVKSLVEKPARDKAPTNTAIVGRYILQPEVFGILESLCKAHTGKKEIQLTDALNQLAQKQPVYGFAFEGTRFDCGQFSGFIEAGVAYALKRADLAPAPPFETG